MEKDGRDTWMEVWKGDIGTETTMEKEGLSAERSDDCSYGTAERNER
jgi:hypothetical protein